MKKWKVLFAIGYGLIVSACGGGGSGDSTLTPAADFSGTWSGSLSGTTIVYTVAQTGSNLVLTRTIPAMAGLTATGAVTGNSASITEYINGIPIDTFTVTLTNDTTAKLTINTCTPPQGYSCSAPGTTVAVTRVKGIGSTLSSDQAVFESLYLSPSASYSLIWSLPSSFGSPVNGTNYFYTNTTTINASPLTAGPQNIVKGQAFSIASTLNIPTSKSPSRYMVGGKIYVDTNATDRFSYQNSSVKDEVITLDGIVLYTTLRSNFQSMPLTGLVAASPLDFAHWFNALFTNPALLKSNVTWGSSSAYIKYTATMVTDGYRVFDYSTTTTGTAPSTVATGTTIAALMASGGIISTSDGVTYTLANGTLSSINGVTTYIATNVRQNESTDVYRTFYELNGNVYIGDLAKAGTVLGGSAYLVTETGITNYTDKYQIRVNKAAVDSLRAAITF